MNDFILFSSYRYFGLGKEPPKSSKINNVKIITDSLINGFKNDNDVNYVNQNIGKNYIITSEEPTTQQNSLCFDEFKRMALNLKIINHNESNIVVKIIPDETIELIIALMSNKSLYKNDIFLFKMYPIFV